MFKTGKAMINGVLVLMLGLSLGLSQAFAHGLPEFTALIEEKSPAVVKITTSTRAVPHPRIQPSPSPHNIPEIFRELFEHYDLPERNFSAMGSGFIISSDGYIATNNHVIEGADEINVRLIDQREFKATLVGSDARSDLALLKIDATDLPVLKFAKPDSLKVGQWVLAIGSPFGLDYSASAGIVSAIGRSIPGERSESGYVPFIQTDVAINPGNSGGPLFNLRGEVVGINSQIYTRTGGSIGLSFAIPSAVAEEVVAQLKEKGRVDRGWLGVVIQAVDKDLAQSFGLDRVIGALVADLEPQGPAAKAGIKVGDVIIKFNGRDVTTQADLPYLVGRTPPNTKVPVVVMRKGKEQVIRVTVGVLQIADAEQEQPVSSPSQTAPEADALGLIVEEVSPQNRGRNNVTSGVVVTNVRPNSPAAQAGLRAGDVIDQLGFNDVENLADYRKVSSELPKGEPQAIRFFRNGQPVFHTITLK
jgi:serine protease Do